MRKVAIAWALFLAFVAGFFLPLSAPPAPACPTEDSVSCHWDARTHGNGLGRSFDADAYGNVTFTD